MNKKDEIIYDENYIAELYQKMELHLISSLKRNLKRHLNEEKKYNIEYPQWQALKLRELQKVKKENAKIIKNHTSNIPKIISKIIKNEYKQGRTSEQKLYAKLNKNKNKPHLLNESFFNIDNKKVNAIIKELTETVKESNSAIYRMMNDKYRRTIVDVSFYLEHGVVSIDKAIDMGIKNFLDSGINCIEYSNGRRVNIADYTRMAVRTASQRAKLHAEGDYRNSKGLYLVRTTKHYTSCKLCKPWEEKILIDDVFSNGKPDGEHKLLSEAMSKGLLHPNCRHGLPTYYPELDEVYDDIAKGITVEEEIMKLKDDLSQYYQRERRKGVWKGEMIDFNDFKNDNKTEKSTKNYKKDNKHDIINYNKANEKIKKEYQKQSNEIYEKFNKEEVQVIEDLINYTEDDFTEINSILAKGTSEGITNEIEQYRVVKNIEKTMEYFDLKDNVIVYKGTKAKYYKNVILGEIIKEKIFYSTSFDKEVAQIFYDEILSKKENKPIMVEIRVPKGTKSIYIGNNGAYAGEQELLLCKDLNYKVIDKKRNKIVLEVINDI